MKRIFIRYVLAVLTRALVKKYQPVIVGVTGSVGKTSAKNAIAAVLARRWRVRKTERNLNTDIGLPLLFIGGVDAKRNAFLWVQNFFRALWLLAVRDHSYPQVLVAEMGADRPGDIGYLVGLAHPFVAVVTGIGNVPVHVQYYPDVDAVVAEKARLVRSLAERGIAVLNADDARVISMRVMTKVAVLSFGFSNRAHVRISGYGIKTEKIEGREVPTGVSFRLEYQGSLVPVSIVGTVGRPVAYAAAAGVACGIALGMNLVASAEALAQWENEPGRMRVVEGVGSTVLLDDTYNAAPAAMETALETLAAVAAKRKVCIIGDMLELGTYSDATHRAIGALAAKICDVCVFVGVHSRAGFEEAKKTGSGARKVLHIEQSSLVADAVKPLLQPGDAVLVKGSQGMRMERAVEALMAHPERAKDLLVRQSREWKSKR